MVFAYRFECESHCRAAMVQLNERHGYIALSGNELLMVTTRDVHQFDDIREICVALGGILLREVEEN